MLALALDSPIHLIGQRAFARRYDMAMDDLFSVPLGYVDPNQGPDDGMSPSPIPPEAFDHRGKWLALHIGKILAIRDTPAELWEEFGDRAAEVSFFHVPTTRIFAR